MKVVLVTILFVFYMSLAYATQPLVAIHDSEFTRALETMPASTNTPTGAGTTGYEWWPSNWHYFVMPESAEEALRSDGTAFQVVGDSNIIAGQLLDTNGLPQYPIVISLASEAISDAEIAQFTNYVAAGGFLFVGSSAFTRTTNGFTRGDFAFANAMGVHMVNPGLTNWILDEFFSKTLNHPIVSHIPNGQLWWWMPLSSEEIPCGVSPDHPLNYYHMAWQVQASNATVIANGGDYGINIPYLLAKPFGKGYFIYHAAMQPLIGHGGFDSGMYAYGIFRNAIEWAFQSAKMPIPKLSPWPYRYDAALIIRHDMEDIPSFINTIEASAQFENSVSNSFGQRAKGDYYFCTGTLRTEYAPPDQTNEIASLQRAISLYGATIGSHNGGLPNAQNTNLATNAYDYWHWGPDEALDLTNPPPPGYPNGQTYALTSISNSFVDLARWGLTNNSGLLEWVAPSFNATREGSEQILAQLGVATSGEEKLGPFPHWTLSTQTSGLRYSFLSLPVSDWYVSSQVGQALEEQSLESVDAMVDYYYNLGALINLYGHSSSAGGVGISEDGIVTSPEVQKKYVVYSMAKPRVWPANADILHAWWLNRSTAQITPTATQNGNQLVTTLAITGASDTNTAAEIFAPSTNYTGLQVFTNGVQAGLTSYRIVGQTIRILVGTTVTNAQVAYTLVPNAQNDAFFVQPGATLTVAAPGVLANDTLGWGSSLTAVLVSGPTHGFFNLNSDGSFSYTPTNNFNGTDSFTYLANDGQTNSGIATVTITVMAAPVITTQPVGVTTNAGATVTLSVTATSTNPITYQWFQNGTNSLSDGESISGSTNATLIISSVLGGNDGLYTVVVSNPAGSVTSAPPALVSVVDPVITTQPVGMFQNDGSTVQLSVGAFGTAPLNYQWQLNGQVIVGATNAVEVLTGGTNGGVGNYSVVVSNVFGSVTGSVTNLQVFASGLLFSDGFTRGTDPGPIFPWVAAVGTWTVTGQMLEVTGLNSPGVANAYVPGTNWGDYSVQGDVRFPAGSYGGGLGGHLNPTTGVHYGAWIYPEGSPGGSSVLKLVKFFDWFNWSGTPMQQVTLPGVGTNWHTLNLAFHANEVMVYYDGIKVIDVTDDDYDGLPPYLSGGITADIWAYSPAFAMSLSNVVVSEFPVVITNQPAGVTINPGSNVTFTVVAGGTAPLSYQWLKNGVTLSDGGNIGGSAMPSLTVSNVSYADAATYSVVVNNPFGSVTSSNAVLTVAAAPIIISQPVGVTTSVSNSVTFTVGALGGLNYQWLKNASAITGATNASLVLTNVSEADSGIYIVIVSNAFGSVTSSNAVLMVLNCLPAPPDLVSWWPGDGNANDIVGTNNGTLEDGATANAAGVVGTAFSFDGTNGFVQIPNSPDLQPTNLTVEAWVLFTSLDTPPVGYSYPGQQYIVFKQNSRYSEFEGYVLSKDRYPANVGTNDTFCWEVASAGGQLVFLESQTIIATNVWYHVAGVRGPDYIQLYVNGQLEAQAPVNFSQDYGNWPLYFGTSGQSYWDHKFAGELDEVSLYNRALSSNEIAAIYMVGSGGKCKAPEITVQPQDQIGILGEGVTFTVVATGTTPLDYQWQHGSVSIAGATNSSLALTNLQSTDAGSYSVMVSNILGSVLSSEATLTMLGAVTITNQPAGSTNNAGDTVSFTVGATGTAPLSYQWYKNGTNALLNSGHISGSTNATLTLTNVLGADAGQYSVLISNVVGVVSSFNATLVVMDPIITSQPASVVQNAESTVQFSVGAYGTMPLGYQWLKNGVVLSDVGNISGSATSNLMLSTVSPGNAGAYSVAVTNVFGSVTSSPAILTVNPLPLTVMVNNQSRSYGATNPSFTGTVTGVQNGDNITATFSCSATAASPVASYPITVSLIDPNNKLVNYSVTTNNGALTVTQAVLTVSADNHNRPYGATNPVLTASYSGFVAGDTTNVLSGRPALNTSATTNSPVGTYSITITNGTLSVTNYSFIFNNGTLTINPAALTVTATNQSKTYGQTFAFAGTEFTAVGLLNNDIISSASLSSAGTPAAAPVNGSPYSIVVTNAVGMGLTNYSINYVNGSLMVNAALLGVSANNTNRVYGATNPVFTVTYTGFVNGENTGVLTGLPSLTTTATTNSPVGAYTIAVTNGTLNATNYSLLFTNGTLTINQAALTVTLGITANNKVYDGTTAATISSNNVVLTGVVSGDTVSLVTNGYTASFASAGVGNNIGVTVGGLTLTGTGATNYTLTQLTGLTANITAAGVSITSGLSANNKTYDRTKIATINSNNVILSGVVGGDLVSISTNGYNARFASAGVGNNIGVTVSGLTLAGASATNYTLTAPAGLTANITAAGVTITSGLSANNKTYDGTTTATISSNNVVLTGVVSGDTVGLVTNGYMANFASTGVGNNIGVTVGGLTLAGASAINYTLTPPSGLAANITGKGLTISSGITANNKPYDGTLAATISSNNVSLNGVVGSDAVNLVTNGYTASFASANVGTGIVVTVSGLTLGGSSATNYTLTPPSGLTANITGKGLTISSGITANGKVYDGTLAATISSNNVSLNGVVGSDAVNLVTNGYTANFASANVGTGIVVTVSGMTLGGSSATNYTLTPPSGLAANITGKGLTINSGITANGKVYDGTLAATISSNNVVLVGVVGSDAVSLSTNGYTANFVSAGVGNNIGVTVGGLTLAGASATNYTLTPPSGLTANITAAGVTISSGITANNKPYDGTLAATISSNNVSLNGVVGSDAVNLVTNGYTASFASANVGTGIVVTVSGLTLAGASAINYTLTPPSGLAANITGKGLTINSGIMANGKVYDGTLAATISSNNVSLNGVVGSDAVNLVTNGYTASFASANVGTGIVVTVSGMTLGGSSATNYTLTPPSGLTANITAAGVTISSGIMANGKVYDGTLAATISSNNVSLNGVVGSDAVNLVTNGYTASFASANVGTGIVVTVSGLTLGGSSATNYTLTPPSGLAANITGKGLTISSGITANGKVYDGTLAATISSNNVSLNGVVGSDTVNLVTNGYTASFASANVGTGIVVTVSGMTLGGSSATNYTLTPPSGLAANITAKTLTIVSVPSPLITSIQLTNSVVTIKWNSVAGGIYRVQYINNLNSNNWNDLSPDVIATGLTAIQTDIVTGVPQQFYRIKVLNSGITANSKVYDGTLAATISSNNVVLVGVVGSDAVSLSTNGYTANFVSAGVGNNIGVTVGGLTLAGASATNYTLTPPSGLAANITGKGLTISSGITANGKVYDGTLATTISSNNVVLVGVAGSDAVSLVTNGYTASFASANVGTGIVVTVSGMTLGGSSATNYTLTPPSGLAANITGKGLTINSGIMANGKVYDGTLAATISSNNVSLNGVVGSDAVNLVTNGYTASFASANVGTGIVVTVSGMTLGGSSATNYTLTPPSGLTANITAAGVTISSGIMANGKVYDGTLAATISSNNVSLNGVVGSDAVNLVTNGYTASFASANVGTGIVVTVSGLTLGGSSATNYTLTPPSGLTANITAAGVTISSGITANNKPYDGTLAATITSNNVSLNGVMGSDAVNLVTNGYTASFASANVGTGIVVTVSGLTLGGSSATNYTLTPPSGLAANITAKTLTIMSVPSPLITSIQLTNSVVTIKWNSVAGGIYRVQYINNLNSNNWNDLSPDVIATGLTAIQTDIVTGVPQQFYRIKVLNSGITANSKVYDGTLAATISSNNVVLVGVVGSDAVSLSTNGYTANFVSAGVGNNIGVTVGGLTLAGASATNYTLTPPSGLAANITGKGLTISSGITANGKVYDGTLAATISSNNVSLNGVVGSDAVSLSTNGYTANFVGAGVGNNIGVTVGGLTLTGASVTNYTLTQPVGLIANITQAPLTVSAVNTSRTYGLPNPSLTVSYSGFVPGEGTNILAGVPNLSTSATTNSPPGSYAIMVGPGTLSAANYTFAFNNGTLTVIAPPQLTGVVLNGSQFVFSYPTIAGQTYQLQYKDNLTAATWTFLGSSMVGPGNPLIITNDLGASPQRFFRLVISP